MTWYGCHSNTTFDCLTQHDTQRSRLATEVQSPRGLQGSAHLEQPGILSLFESTLKRKRVSTCNSFQYTEETEAAVPTAHQLGEITSDDPLGSRSGFKLTLEEAE
jgi:hypothetical protein